MNLQHFRARLDDQHLQADQQVINQFMEEVLVKQTATQFVPGAPDYWSILIFFENANGTPTRRKEIPPKAKPVQEEPTAPLEEPTGEPPAVEEELTEEQAQLLAALRTWRKDKSHELQRQEYLIAHNATLISLAKEKPRKMSDLSSIKGLGTQKVAQYGDDIMAILNAF